jgi:hypothetical protein
MEQSRLCMDLKNIEKHMKNTLLKALEKRPSEQEYKTCGHAAKYLLPLEAYS